MHHQKKSKSRTFVHGDDFAVEGSRDKSTWKKQHQGRGFEIKTRVNGLGKERVRKERVPIRVVRVTDAGWEMESDQRHTEIIFENLNLQAHRE